MEIFWGRERRDLLLQLIFGPRDMTRPNSKTQISALSNMITLSPDAHGSWSRGKSTLEPLGVEANPYELRARFRWTPQKSESPRELGIATDSSSIELIPLTAGTRLVNLEILLPIMDGDIVTFTTNDPINAPLPHRDLLMLQCFFIRVLRMAVRAGEDMLETFDSDDELTISSAGSIEQPSALERIRSPPYHDGTADLTKASLAPSTNLGPNITTSLEQSPQTKRWRPFSRK